MLLKGVEDTKKRDGETLKYRAKGQLVDQSSAPKKAWTDVKVLGETAWLDAKLTLKCDSDGTVTLRGKTDFSATSKKPFGGSPISISIEPVLRRGNGLELDVEATASWGEHSADAAWEHEVTAKPAASKAKKKQKTEAKK